MDSITVVIEQQDVTKIYKIFKQILANHMPKDDTFVEKLLSFFQNSIAEECGAAAEGILSGTHVFDCLRTCTTSSGICPDSLSFFYKLTSVLAPHHVEKLLQQVQLEMLLQRVSESEFAQDASTRCAWVWCVRALCRTKVGCDFVLVRPFLAQHTLSLTRDTSMFVATAARELVAFVIMETTDLDNHNVVQYVEYVISALKSGDPESREWDSAIDIVRIIGERDKERVITLVSQNDLLDHLVTAKAFSQSRNTCLSLQTILDKLPTDIVVPRCTSLCDLLKKKGCLVEAIEMAAWTIQRCESGEHHDQLVTLVTQPLLSVNTLTLTKPPMRVQLAAINAVTEVVSKISLSALLTFLQRCVSHDRDNSESSSSRLIQATLKACSTIVEKQPVDEDVRKQILKAAIDSLTDTNAPYMQVASALGLLRQLYTSLAQQIQTKEEPKNIELDERNLSEYVTEVSSAISRLLCVGSWEVRDEAASFVSSVVPTLSDLGALPLLLAGGLTNHVCQAMRDRESYVRASAIVAMVALVKAGSIDSGTYTTFCNTLIYIASCDGEIFARRAAVAALSDMYDLVSEENSNEVMEVMSKVASDSDWEVKMSAVSFWEKVVKQRLHCDNLEASLKGLLSVGCFNALVTMSSDPDTKVRLATGQLLATMKEKMVGLIVAAQEDIGNKCDNISNDIGESVDIYVTSDAKNGGDGITESCDSVKMRTDAISGEQIVSESQLHTKQSNHSHANGEAVSKSPCQKSDRLTLSQFCVWLGNLDVGALCEEASLSIDKYAGNPHSLIEDVLRAVCEDIMDGEEDNAASVDCY